MLSQVVWQPPRKPPLHFVLTPQGKLRRAVLGLEALQQLDRPKAFLVGLEGNGVLSQGHFAIFQGQRLPVEPNHRLAFGKVLFAAGLLLAEAEIAQSVQPAGEVTGKEDPVQMIVGRIHHSCSIFAPS
jgi:hypothetical protein